MAFDPIRDDIVAFGGLNHSGSCSATTPCSVWAVADMWQFKNAQWAQLHAAHVPPPRDSAVLVFDVALGVVVMYGGRDVPASVVAGTGGDVGTYPFAADTWTWDGLDWTQLQPPHHPVLFVPAATYDYARNVVLLLGFAGNSMQTWTFDGSDWTQHEIGVAKPDPPRTQSALSFDPASKTVVTFGGANSGAADTSAVWEWDGQSWTRTVSASPFMFGGLRATPAPEFDRTSMLIYDGAGGPGPISTWRWNGEFFVQLSAPHQPNIAEALLIADPARHRVLLFGWTWPDLQFQVWSWSGDDWGQVTM